MPVCEFRLCVINGYGAIAARMLPKEKQRRTMHGYSIRAMRESVNRVATLYLKFCLGLHVCFGEYFHAVISTLSFTLARKIG